MTEAQEKVCNLCGNSCCPDEKRLSGTWQSDQPHGLIDAKVVGDYESYHLLDMTQYTFSICEACLRKLFVAFKIPPKAHDVDFPDMATIGSGFAWVEGAEQSWKEDQSVYEYRVWCDAGKHHEAFLNKKCNQVVDCPNAAIYLVLLSDQDTEELSCEEHAARWGRTMNARLAHFVVCSALPTCKKM